jgi:hypothetical protein
MPNTVYPKAREGFLGGDLDWDAQDFRFILIDLGAYTYSALHDFLNDVIAGSRVAVSGPITSKTKVDGVAYGVIPVLASVAGPTIEGGIIYQHSGVETTSRLVCFYDTVPGLPITPNGTNITTNTQPSGLFAL